ncbi:MAG: YdcF family protein [Thiohalomonadales bacterium]
MEWVSLFFEPLMFIAIGLFTIAIAHKLNVKYTIKIVYALIGFYILVATPLGANYLVSLVEINKVDEQCDTRSIDIIVILSGGITGDPNSLDEIWRLKEASYRRTLSGLNLAKRLSIKTIIVSGGYGGRFTEAHLMKKLIYDIGFSGTVIIDRDSKTTFFSAVNVTKIMRDKKIDKYWLVTSAIHMKRAGSTFLKQGIEPCRYPVNSKYIDTSFPASIIPQISALDKSSAGFHEIIGYIWYWIAGKN